MLTNSDLEVMIYPSRIYGKEIQEYSNFFASLFGNELISFGYDRLDKKGFYEGISNQPRLTEIYIETQTYKALEYRAKHDRCTGHGFVYPNESSDDSIYNNFRIQLNKELDLYTTFYITENCLSYQTVVSWNFRAPLKSNSLTQWENHILQCFLNNRKSIQYALDQFKTYYRSISKKIVPIQIFKPTIERQNLKPTELGEKLVEEIWLTKNDLYLKNIDLTKKEASYIYFYLQGMNAKEMAEKMFVSRRTVEDHMKRIKQKLRVKSRSQFHTAIEKINLWRNTL